MADEWDRFPDAVPPRGGNAAPSPAPASPRGDYVPAAASSAPAPIVARPEDITAEDIEAARTGRLDTSGRPIFYTGPSAAAEDRIARERATGSGTSQGRSLDAASVPSPPLGQGYSIDPDGTLVLHIGGRQLRPIDRGQAAAATTTATPPPLPPRTANRPDLGDIPLPPDVQDKLRAAQFWSDQDRPGAPRVPGPIDQSGREVIFQQQPGQTPDWVPQALREHVDVQGLLEHPGRAALETGMGILGAAGMPATAPGSVSGPVSRALAPVAQPIENAAGRVLSAATAAPKTTGAGIAGAAVAATTGEAGDDPQARAELQQQADDRESVKQAQTQLQQALTQRQSLADQLAAATKDRDLQVRGGPGVKAGRGKDYQEKTADITRLKGDIDKQDDLIADLRVRASPEFLVHLAKLREAERARRGILESARKPFEESQPWLAEHQWLLPATAGMLTALFMRGRPAIDVMRQGGRWWEAVKTARDTSLPPGTRAAARILAEKFEKQMPKQTWSKIAASYIAPVGASLGEGAFLGNTPEFYNLFLPPENPERKAYEAFVKLAPTDSKEMENARALLEHMPKDNPARDAAIRHFTQLRPALVKGIEGAGEAAASAAFFTTGTKAIPYSEGGLPRSETQALKAAARKQQRINNQAPKLLRVQAAPVAQQKQLPPPAGAGQTGASGQAPGAQGQGPGGQSPTVETWQTPSGDVIKRGATGKTWHNEKGHRTPAPPPGSKRLSMLDRILYYGGYA